MGKEEHSAMYRIFGKPKTVYDFFDRVLKKSNEKRVEIILGMYPQHSSFTPEGYITLKSGKTSVTIDNIFSSKDVPDNYVQEVNVRNEMIKKANTIRERLEDGGIESVVETVNGEVLDGIARVNFYNKANA